MDASKLTDQELHDNLRSFNLQTRKPFEKYPAELIELVRAAFARGMTIKEVQAMSEIPESSLFCIRRRIRRANKSEEQLSPGFIKFTVEETDTSQQKATSGDRVSVKVDASGLLLEIGVDSLTPQLLQTLRSMI